jgi:hypothetical protein
MVGEQAQDAVGRIGLEAFAGEGAALPDLRYRSCRQD